MRDRNVTVNRYKVGLECEQGVSWLVTSGTGVCQLRCISWVNELPPVSWAGDFLPAKYGVKSMTLYLLALPRGTCPLPTQNS